MLWALVFLLGGLGAVSRVGVASLVVGRAWPWSTFAVNIVGCLLIGVVYQWFEARGAPAGLPWRVAIIGGFLGGFTTFSAFGLETLLLVRTGQSLVAFGYVLSSIGLGLGAASAGIALGRHLG